MRRVLLFTGWLLLMNLAYAQTKPATKPAANKSAVSKPAANKGSKSIPTNRAGSYNIAVKVTPLKNTWLYLYNYYGKYFQIADSVRLNANSEGVFKGNRKLFGGIYLVVTERKVRLFDVLIDEDQDFSIVADTLNPERPQITGSLENSLYLEYTAFLEKVGPRLNSLKQQFSMAKTKADSTALQQQIIAADAELEAYRRNVVEKNPESMLAAFFNAMKKPDVPKELPIKPDGSRDSSFPFRYTQEHFWDDVEIGDDRLVRTPFFEQKLDDYFKYYVVPDADSVIKEVKYMLLSSREATEMYRYLLAKFTNKYINPEIMGQDKVFIYLFQNHYLQGDTSFLTPKDRETIMNRGWNLIANQIGEPARELNLVDITGKSTPMHSIKAPFTFLVFWDPNCGHCKETVPRIDSIYRAKWKAMGVKVYAVNIDEKALKGWQEFISNHKLLEWTHVYQTKKAWDEENAAGRPNFRQLYDVYQTPTLYLLDEQKRIIAKKLDVFGFDEVLMAKQKQQNKK